MRTTQIGKRLTVAMLVGAIMLGISGFAVAQFRGTYRVEAFATDRLNVWAPSGDTRIIVDGDGTTDLDCFVYNRNGRLLGMDDDLTDYCIVDVWQPSSGNVRVVVENLGRVWNQYDLNVE